MNVIRHRWYPDREGVEAVSPDAIGPFSWPGDAASYGFMGKYVYVPIAHWHPASYYLEMYRLLSGWRTPLED